MMEAWGNARGKAYYEADVPPEYPRPRVGAGVRELQRWIRDKYEKRMFLPRDGSVPSLGTSAGASAPAPPVASSSSSPSKRKLSGQRPASVAAPAPEPEPATLAALAPSMDLLSFDAFAAPEPAHTAAAAQTNAAPAVSGFSDFQNVAQPPSTQQSDQPMQVPPQAHQPESFEQFAEQPTQQPTQQQVHAYATNSIMSMFNAPTTGGGMAMMPSPPVLQPQQQQQQQQHIMMNPRQQQMMQPQEQMSQQHVLYMQQQQQQQQQQQNMLLMMQQQQQQQFRRYPQQQGMLNQADQMPQQVRGEMFGCRFLVVQRG